MNQNVFAFAAADPLTDIICLNSGQFTAGFLVWLADNRKIWDRFETEANKLWNRQIRHWSARTIVEFLRHETALFDSDRTFKINNNIAPDLARLYRLRYPDRADFFETRVQHGTSRAA